MNIKSLNKIKSFNKKTVLVRCDFNVPIEKGRVKENYKMKMTLDTINFLLEKGAKVVLMSHLGRPEKKGDLKFSLKPVAKELSLMLEKKVIFSEELFGKNVKKKIKDLKDDEVLLLENLRYFKEEKKNSLSFAKKLSSLADIYVNDAFAVSHREAASVSAIKKYLPSYAGLLVEKEVNNLSKGLEPKEPLVSVIGGIKISTKIKLLEQLSKDSKYVLLGGALANNFFLAQGKELGKSLVDLDSLDWINNFLKNKKNSQKIILPVDFLVSSGKKRHIKKINEIKEKDNILDIGPETIALFSKYIKLAKTVIWNGPMGKFEDDNFKQGTLAVARLIAIASTKRMFSIVGGGETVQALKQLSLDKYINWVSTGGGAMLQFLSKEKMPGLDKIVKDYK
ncbi:phosphoglycerate kinase [bacterium]|nr:phosphoglycerate kinase [bacterium]